MLKIVTTMFVVLMLFGCSSQDSSNSVDQSATPGSPESVKKRSSTAKSDTNDKSDSADCPIPGDLIHWQAEYCMWQAETDDFANEAVQKCHSERTAIDKRSSKTVCEKKRFYKRAYCRILVDNGHFEGTVTQCMSAKDEMPSTVKNKGVS